MKRSAILVSAVMALLGSAPDGSASENHLAASPPARNQRKDQRSVPETLMGLQSKVFLETQSVQGDIEQARQAYKDGHWASAETIAKAAIARAITLDEKLHRSDLGELGAFFSKAIIFQGMEVLADTYFAEGKYSEAQPLYEQIIFCQRLKSTCKDIDARGKHIPLADILKVASDRKSPDYMSMGHLLILGLILDMQQRSTEADQVYLAAFDNHSNYWYIVGGPDRPFQRKETEALCKKALAQVESTRGVDDPATATRCQLLGLFYSGQKNNLEAQQYFTKAITIREKRLTEDPKALCDAVEMFKKSPAVWGVYNRPSDLDKLLLKAKEMLFGLDNPEVLKLLTDIANQERSSGRYVESAKLYESLLERQKRAEAGNVNIAETLSKLSGLYKQQGLIDKAAAAMKQALNLRKTAAGNNDAQSVRDIEQLAELLAMQGKTSEAETILLECIKLNDASGDKNSRSSITLLKKLAGYYEIDRNTTQAEAQYREALQRAQEMEGQYARDLTPQIRDLAQFLDKQSRYADEEALLQQQVAIAERGNGPNSLDLVARLMDLASCLEKEQKFAAAEDAVLRAISIYKTSPNSSEMGGLNYQDRLVVILTKEQKYDEAERILKGTLSVIERTSGERSSAYQRRLQRLAEFYTDAGRERDAKATWNKLDGSRRDPRDHSQLQAGDR